MAVTVRERLPQQGSRLLKNVEAQAAIAAKQMQQLVTVNVRVEDVLRDLLAIAHTELQTLSAQSGVPARWADKLKALELLMKHLGLAAANVSFGFVSAVSDQAVYRFLTNGLPNMAAVDTRAAQMRQLAPASPAMRPLGEAIERLESSIRRQRLELSYAPANPRISVGEAGFFRELSFYFKGGGGAAQNAMEIMQRFRALYEANDISMGYTVNSLVLGTGANLRVIFFARDAVDFYTAYGEAIQSMGQEFQTLATELIALCNRTEFTNWTIRGDLSYQPVN